MAKLVVKRTVAIFGIGCVLSFILGLLGGSRYFGAEMSAARQLALELGEQQIQLDVQSVAMRRSQVMGDVDKQVIEKLRRSIATLDLQLSGQQEELTVYRKLLDTDNAENGLHILRPNISASEAPSSFGYRFVIRQKAAVLNSIQVNYTAQIKGQLNGKPVSYSLAELDVAVASVPVRTKLKYFRVVEGVLRLPQHFMPESMTVSAWLARAPGRHSERTLDWPGANNRPSSSGN